MHVSAIIKWNEICQCTSNFTAHVNQLENLTKMQILTQQVWDGAQVSAFPKALR